MPLAWGDITLEPETGTLWCGGNLTTLRRQAARVLAELMNNGHHYYREQLAEAAVHRPPHVPPIASIRLAIRDIRAALETVGSAATIETRPGYGWRLVMLSPDARDLLRRKRFIISSEH